MTKEPSRILIVDDHPRGCAMGLGERLSVGIGAYGIVHLLSRRTIGGVRMIYGVFGICMVRVAVQNSSQGPHFGNKDRIVSVRIEVSRLRLRK